MLASLASDPKGIHTSLLGSLKVDGENLPKTKSSVLMYHDEKSLRSRRKRDKGQRVANAERMLVVGGEEAGLPPYRERKLYEGTTRGEILGPIIAAGWDASLLQTSLFSILTFAGTE